MAAVIGETSGYGTAVLVSVVCVFVYLFGWEIGYARCAASRGTQKRALEDARDLLAQIVDAHERGVFSSEDDDRVYMDGSWFLDAVQLRDRLTTLTPNER